MTIPSIILRAWGGVIGSWKSLLVVFAFSCAVTLAVGAHQLGKQRATLQAMADTNNKWQEAWTMMEKARVIEIENTEHMRKRIDEINASAAEGNQRLKELERSNADVKSFLDARIPHDLRGLLNKPQTSAN